MLDSPGHLLVPLGGLMNHMTASSQVHSRLRVRGSHITSEARTTRPNGWATEGLVSYGNLKVC